MTQKLLQYDVVGRLGEGARSTIYAVYDPVLKKIYALKHVIRKEDKDQRFIDQVKAEYEVSHNFNHPNLRKSFELKIIKAMLIKDKEAFLVMELFDGKALDERLPGDLVQVVDVFIQAAEGLKVMHQLGYVHCDIKPNNILLNDLGEVKVIDFGQSCKVGTVKERIQGTPDYIAPEQVARKPVTPQTDVFNLGATLYWAMAGKTIPTLYTVNKQGQNSFLLDTRIETPQQLNPRVPTALSNLIMECVATAPAKRPPGMQEVIQRLELAKHILNKQGKKPVPQTGPSLLDDEEDEI
jgi:serine/threonine-protein kinase